MSPISFYQLHATRLTSILEFNFTYRQFLHKEIYLIYLKHFSKNVLSFQYTHAALPVFFFALFPFSFSPSSCNQTLNTSDFAVAQKYYNFRFLPTYLRTLPRAGLNNWPRGRPPGTGRGPPRWSSPSIPPAAQCVPAASQSGCWE